MTSTEGRAGGALLTSKVKGKNEIKRDDTTIGEEYETNRVISIAKASFYITS